MKLAVLGFGTVGRGVYDMLAAAEGLEQGPVLVRPGKDDEPYKRTQIQDIADDPSVWAVAEVMGGVEPAFSYACTVMKAGKHFITSNKALVAAKGVELQRCARENGVAFLFSAACGGAVPFLHNLALAARGDRIESLGGILNGTTNYMLDAMQRRHMDYADALADAQRLGYAEKDPRADVSGLDSLRKIMLACAVAWDRLPTEGLLCEGIENLTAADVQHFQARGYTCRLLASGLPAGDTVSAWVEPVLLPEGAAECAVRENYNMARYCARNAGPLVFMGQGAGRYPTASAVLRDAGSIRQGAKAMLQDGCRCVRADNSAAKRLYYVRCDEAHASLIPAETVETEGGFARILTKELSVEAMHAMAKEMREKGGSVFFAAIGG